MRTTKLTVTEITILVSLIVVTKMILSISAVRGQGSFFGPLHGPLVLVGGSKILVT